MWTLSFSLLALSVTALTAACGNVTPLEASQACPCAPGFTCCNGACTAGDVCPAICAGSIALGTQTVAADSDASAGLPSETVTGQATTNLNEGTTPFNYAMSLWPKPYGWQLDGWLLTASAGQSFTFQVWAEVDGGTDPLSLVMYGPLDGLDTNACSGGAVSAEATVGADVRFTTSGTGTYFIAPFHEIVETPAGLAFQGLNDSALSHAFILMTSAE